MVEKGNMGDFKVIIVIVVSVKMASKRPWLFYDCDELYGITSECEGQISSESSDSKESDNDVIVSRMDCI